MAHKFDAAHMNKLDNAWRREHLPSYATLEKLGLTSADIVADIGCGIGYFSIPAAEIVGKTNKVFALDTSEEMLDEVDKRAAVGKLSNIVTVKTEEYDFKLPDATATFALLVNVLHEVEDVPRFVTEIRRILKHGGRLAVIDWEKKAVDIVMGPSINQRIAREEVIRCMEAGGFALGNGTQLAEGAFYGLVFTK